MSPAFAAEVAALRDELRGLGCFERPVARYAITWCGMLVLALGGLAGCVTLPGLWLKALAFAVSTYGFVGIATLGHTASHGGVSDRRLVNQVFFYMSYPFLLHLSARYWFWSHVQVHHPSPNLVGIDVDCDLRPAFALNQQHFETGLGRGWYRWQGLSLLLVLPLNGFNIIRQSWRRLLHELVTPGQRQAGAWVDLACLVGHVAAWLALPMFFFSPAAVLGFYALRVATIGCVLFAVLAPGHYPAAAVCLEADQRERGDFWLRQLATTVNFRTGLLGRLLCSGLDQQNEHHLFPGASHLRLSRMRGPVRAFCARNGLPYHELSWARAIWESYLVFWRPKPVLADVESLRLRLDPESYARRATGPSTASAAS
jgi:fatty acid desaturase